ncbi:extracellular solute-binding protein [Marinobacterium rhizophilum]|uniref:extracellular solute-binding protein n=1 Tax=Marinobacterium rhizophilum TaxID=420402 RepID=UPI00036D41F6|nr:extracellular solute-binding protein [Marinobacterium rhizophilum]
MKKKKYDYNYKESVMTKKSLIKSIVGVALAAALTQPVAAQQETEVTLSRFFGSCEADYGSVADVTKARGECGIITALVNKFNTTNELGVVVKPQVAEWATYYDQLTARLAARDVPTIAVMHESVLGDFVARKLVEPLDEGFEQVGIDTANFTEQAARGTIIDGTTYAMPFDTWAWLWHFNLNLFEQAGLTQADGSPVLPKNPDELLIQARQFKDATGKPYFGWITAGESVAPTRTFLTLVNQQGGELFRDNGHRIDMQGKEADIALNLMKQLWNEGHIKQGLDYSGAQQAYLNGDVGINVNGTWVIDNFVAASQKAGSPLEDGYTVVPFATLYDQKAVFADGHSWVMLKGGAKNEKERAGALAFLKFLWDHNYEWSRTGHLPVSKSIIDSEEFHSLPFRTNILEISSTGRTMPSNVARQRAVETIIGEEISNMMLSDKPADDVKQSIEKRVNRLISK